MQCNNYNNVQIESYHTVIARLLNSIYLVLCILCIKYLIQANNNESILSSVHVHANSRQGKSLCFIVLT